MVHEDILGETAARTVSLGERLRFIAAHSPVATRNPLEDEIERIEEILEALAAAQHRKR